MKKANAPPTIKEKARLAFIRGKANQMKDKSRHKHPVPGPFTAIDRARALEHYDPEPEENSSATDRIEYKTISTLSRAEITVRYTRHQQKRNESHRETHFEPDAETAPEAGAAARPSSPQNLMREKAVNDFKAKQRQKEYATSTPEAETLRSPEKADRPYRKTREPAPARHSSRQQLSGRSQPTYKQTPSPKAQIHREQGRRLAQGTAIKESVQKQSRRERRLRKLKAAVERAARASARSALTAGGGLLLLILPLLLLFGAEGALFGGSGDLEKAPVSDEVKAYAGLIQIYAMEHCIPEYTELIMAVMMQESGGQGTDPMQASESGYNMRYPHAPNSITDPEYSIDVGVHTLADVLNMAAVESPIDLDRISLALQGYNFGPGYISWALANYGGYSELNAIEFSDMMAAQYGWAGYGDKAYVSHVLRYYPVGRAFMGENNTAIVVVAQTQLGNVGGEPYWRWWGLDYRVEWCAIFVSWCADQCGYLDAGVLPKMEGVRPYVDWFIERGQWQGRDYEPIPGDIIFFDWESDGLADHVGIVEKVENGLIYTVEGNSGDRCVENRYSLGSAPVYGFGLPMY